MQLLVVCVLKLVNMVNMSALFSLAFQLGMCGPDYTQGAVTKSAVTKSKSKHLIIDLGFKTLG